MQNLIEIANNIDFLFIGGAPRCGTTLGEPTIAGSRLLESKSGVIVNRNEDIMKRYREHTTWNCQILDSNFHQLEDSSFSSPIIVSDKVWRGCNVTILKGVTIRDGAVIGANSVVTSNVSAYSVVAGRPARVIIKDVLWKS